MLPSVMVLGTVQTASRNRGLWVAGQDMAARVPIESIAVTEMGPDGVSSMTFRVDDPLLEVTINAGDDVQYWDTVNNVPNFRGFVQGYDLDRGFGQTGRQYAVTCVGIEAVLDWAVLPADFTLALDALVTGNAITPVLQAIVSASTGIGPIRAFAAGTTDPSRQATPMEQLPPALVTTSAALTITAGTTVREAFRQVIASITSPHNPFQVLVTVDFYYGLRVWRQLGASPFLQPNDYTSITIDNAVSPFTEGLSYSIDGTSDVHAVLVIGTGVSALRFDGSGIMGPVTVITNTAITTVAGAQAAGDAYLSSFFTPLRASFERQDFTPTYTVHAGSGFILTDTVIGLTARTFRILQIDKTFNAVRENWTVSFGGTQPRASSLIRRLTRNTLS